MAIVVTETIRIEDGEIGFEFVRASGPGGQNVNKVATAAKLYFDIDRSPSLPEEVRRRLRTLAGKRVNAAGVLIIDARRFRSQEGNRRDALERLTVLIRLASVAPRPRRPTRPGTAAKTRRIEEKKRHGLLKQGRKKDAPDRSE
jgi:ribosome-associated protein